MHGNTSFGKRSVGSIALGALLIFGVYTILPMTSGAYAQATTTITTSADSHGNKFFGPALLEVMLQSSQHAADSGIGTAQVTVDAFGSSRQLSLTETTGTSGIFLMYVKVDDQGDPANALATAEAPQEPENPFHPTGFVSLYIGSGGASDNTAYNTSGTERSISTTNVAEGGAISFTFGGVVKTVTWDDTPATISLDRSNFGPESKLYVRVYDPDMNLDPTDSNTFIENAVANLTSGADHPVSTSPTFTETGSNTARFEATFNVADLGAGQSSTSRSLTANDYKNFTSGAVPAVAVGADNNLVGTASTSYVVQIVNGQFSMVPGTLTYAGELPLTLSDSDRNLNSKTQETLSGKLLVVPDGQIERAFHLRENGLSSSQFVPGYGQDRIKVTFKENSNADSGILFLRPGDEVELIYNDTRNTLGGVPANTSSVIREISNTAPQLTVDRTGVSATSEIVLTMTDLDLNDDSSIVESYTVPFTAVTDTDATVSFVVPTIGTVDVFNMVIERNNALINLNAPFSVTFIETGADTGIFEAQIDLADLDAAFATTFEDGDIIDIEITDVLEEADGPSADVTLTVGVEDPVIQVGRSTLPVPRLAAADVGPTGAAELGIANLDQTLLDITIIDDARNTNRLTQETIASSSDSETVDTGTGSRTFTLGVSNDLILTLQPAPGTSWTAGDDITISVDTAIRETGPDTGVFTGTLAIDADEEDKPAWVGAKLTIEYGDASTRTVTFTSRQAVLTTDTTLVVNGGTLTITVTDADANRDTGEEEEVKVRVGWVPSSGGADEDEWLTLEETGDDTGVFTETLDVGVDSVGGVVFRVAPNEEVEIFYYDLTPTVSATKATWDDANNSGLRLERTLTTGASSGALSVGIAGSTVGPSATIEVTVADTDVNVNPSQRDDLLDRVTIATDRGVNVVLDLEETAANSGIFVGEINLVPSGDLANQAENGDEVTVPVLPGDVVSVRYQDESDENGRRTTISKQFSIISVDPEISVDKTVYAAGDQMTITLADIDADADSDSNDIINVRVTSTSDAVGLSSVQLIETDSSTGVFVGTVSLTSQFTSGSLQVRNGDTVTIRYTDQFPADYKDRVDAGGTLTKDFLTVVQVGGSVTGSTTPTAPAVRDAQGSPISQVLAGQQVVLATTITNNESTSGPFVALVEVRDSNDVTIYLQWQEGTLAANGSVNVGVSWTPDSPGTYTVRVFVLSSLVTPQILSPVVTSTVNVS